MEFKNKTQLLSFDLVDDFLIKTESWDKLDRGIIAWFHIEWYRIDWKRLFP